MNQISLVSLASSPFDVIRHVDDTGAEHWTGRELQPLMSYPRWADFLTVIKRAIAAAINTGHDVEENFRRSPEVSGRRGPAREDYRLTRFGAYLVAMNGDPNKPEVAAAQAYFATRTREAEVAQESAGDDLDMIESMVAALRADRKRIAAVENRQQTTEAKLAAIEGHYDWFTALGYAKLNGLRSSHNYLQRVGGYATRLMKARGEAPEKRADPTFGTVNVYPVDILARAFEETPR